MRRGLISTIVAGVIVVTALPAQAAPGALDRSFGGDGTTSTRFDQYAAVVDIGVRPSGKVVAVGNVGVQRYDAPQYGRIVRYLANGAPDRSFGAGGVVKLGFRVSAMALQPDGHVLVIGWQEGNFLVERFEPDGSIDRSWGRDGNVTTDFGYTTEYGEGLAVQPDGKVLAIGSSQYDFAIARYLPDGTLDRSFSKDGRITINFGAYEQGYDLTLYPDGRILATGNSLSGPCSGGGCSNDISMARLRPNGTLDPSFGGDGKASGVDVGLCCEDTYGEAIQPDGKILVAARAWVYRFEPNGDVDESFGRGGYVEVPFPDEINDQVYDLALQSDGKILAIGTALDAQPSSKVNGRWMAVARFGPRGALDKSFGHGGIATTSFGPDGTEGYQGSLTPNGRLVVGGAYSHRFAVARYLLR
jgi:uncharacterized delta-60 repeat protein